MRGQELSKHWPGKRTLNLMMALLAVGAVLNVNACETGDGSNTMTASAPALRAIVVSSRGQALPFNGIQQFTATGFYTNVSSKYLTNQAIWSSTSRNAATVSSARLVTGLASGTNSIAATLGGVTGSKTLRRRNLRFLASVLPLHADL